MRENSDPAGHLVGSVSVTDRDLAHMLMATIVNDDSVRAQSEG